MEEALVAIEELESKLPFTMDEDDRREAFGALESLSDDARMYGKGSWLTSQVTPRQVKNLIVKAAVRYMKNYEGFVQSRAGDETVIWTDRGQEAGGAYFTDGEVARLRTFASQSAFWSVNATAWGPMQYQPQDPSCDPSCTDPCCYPDSDQFVPGQLNGDPVLYYSDPVEPW